MDIVQKIREELVRLREGTSIGLSEHENGVEQGRMEIIDALSIFLDSMQEEPVSENRKEAILKKAHELANRAELISDKFLKSTLIAVAIDMAEWCDSHSIKESVSEDLEKEIQTTIKMVKHLDLSIDDIVLFCAHHYSKWQKEQMMVKAVNAEASYTMSVPSICISLPLGVNVGDKVKVIVIKED